MTAFTGILAVGSGRQIKTRLALGGEVNYLTPGSLRLRKKR